MKFRIVLFEWFIFLAIAFLVVGYNERMSNADKLDIKKQVESQCQIEGIEYYL